MSYEEYEQQIDKTKRTIVFKHETSGSANVNRKNLSF